MYTQHNSERSLEADIFLLSESVFVGLFMLLSLLSVIMLLYLHAVLWHKMAVVSDPIFTVCGVQMAHIDCIEILELFVLQGNTLSIRHSPYILCLELDREGELKWM